MKPKIAHLIWLALTLAILPTISLADNLPNQILWNKDGAEMSYIPAGSFEMGDHLNNMSSALPVHTVTLDGFYMDKTEVTVRQFKAFLADNSSYSWGGNWDNVARYSPTDDHPMIYVTWSDAVAYAEWAGKRLPTEAEWEYAARGGLEGKRYPWGDEISHDDANYRETDGKDKWDEQAAPVGSFGANGYGLYDLAGNVWEWCADWYDQDYYINSPASNPLGPENGQVFNSGLGPFRVLRGGGWLNGTGPLRVALRNGYLPSDGDVDFGFRCVSGLNFTLDLSAGGDLTGDEEASSNEEVPLPPADDQAAEADDQGQGQEVAGADGQDQGQEAAEADGQGQDQEAAGEEVEGVSAPVIEEPDFEWSSGGINTVQTIELTPRVKGTWDPTSPYSVDKLGYYLPHSIVEGPQHGTAELETFDLQGQPGGTRLVYTPETDFAGRDSLTFQAKTKDGKIVSEIATLWLTIYRPAVDQTLITESGQAVEIALWDAASLKEGQSNGHVIKSQPQNGTLVEGEQTSPNVTYTPKVGFVGSDSFTFHLLNYPDQLVTNIATVTITVAAEEKELVAVDQVVRTKQGQPVRILLSEGLPEALVLTLPSHGSLAGGVGNLPIRLEPREELAYTPLPDFVGSDSLTFKTVSTDQLLAGQTLAEIAQDEQMGSNIATVIINVAQIIKVRLPGGQSLSLNATIKEAGQPVNIQTAVYQKEPEDDGLAVKPGTFIEYQRKIPADSAIQTGGVYVHTASGKTLSPEGIVSAGVQEMRSVEGDSEWTHQKISLDPIAGEVISAITIGTQLESAPVGQFSLQVDNIQLTDGAKLVEPIWLSSTVADVQTELETYGKVIGVEKAELSVKKVEEVMTEGEVVEPSIEPVEEPTLAGDVNADNTVNIFDLVLVASQFGLTGTDLSGDVNGDISVNIFDLVLVASNFGQSVLATAPAIVGSVQLTSQQKRQVVAAIATLEGNLARSAAEEMALHLLKAIIVERLPMESRLLANYPNPFNPETWIPFELSQDTAATITIYDVIGRRVRQLDLGYRLAGRYVSVENSAYWDGKTERGEDVSSGTYFYQIQAGDYTETRKMVILK